MIPARKKAWFVRWFAKHAEQRLAKQFANVRVRGLETLRDAIAQGPVLVVSNHTAWWDPLVALVLTNRVLTSDSYAMMDAKNLRALPFFGWVGAFGVDRDVASDGAATIRHAVRLLDRAGKVVWIFPQGLEVPITVRPLAFEAGAGAVAAIAKRARVLPVALRYEHGATPEADVWISIGPPLAPAKDTRAATTAQADAVERELDGIERALRLADERATFAPVLTKRQSLVDRWSTAALAWVARPRTLPTRRH